MFCSNCGAKNDDGYKFCMKCGAPLNDEPAGFNAGAYAQQPDQAAYDDSTQVLSEEDFKSIQSFSDDEPEDNTVMLDDVLNQGGLDDTYPSVDVTEEPDNQSWGNTYGDRGRAGDGNSYYQTQNGYDSQSDYGNVQDNYQQAQNSYYQSAQDNYQSAQDNYQQAQGNYQSASNNYQQAQGSYQAAPNPAFQDDYQRKPALDGPIRLKTGGAFLIMFLGYMPMLWALLYLLIVATGTALSPKLFFGVYVVLGLAYCIFIIVLACIGGKTKSRAAMCRGMILNAIIRFVVTAVLVGLIIYIGADTLEKYFYTLYYTISGY